MGLSDDQRAMLRLLAQREQGYEDIAALMGLSVDEVRARVKDALGQLEAEGKEAPPVPEPPAAPSEPEPPAVAAEPPAAEEKPTAEEKPAAEEPKTEPPAAAPPPPPPAAEPAASAGAPRQPSGSGGRRLRLPKDPGARVAIAAGAVVLVALVVVLIVSGGGGGSSTTTTSASSGTEAAEGSNTASSTKGLVKADLKPVSGGEGSGEAIFGRYKEKLALQVIADGLEPTVSGEAYTVWIARSPKKMLPLASAKANKKGQIRAEFEVPTEVLAYLANETFRNIVISRTSTPLLKAALTKATKEEKPPIYTGTHVLEGEITGPIVGAAKREEQAEEQKE